MTCTNQQVKKLMKYKQTTTQEVAALKAGMSIKTARKYLKARSLPSELSRPHNWVTRTNPFTEVWEEITSFLFGAPRVQAKTIFQYLQNKYPGRFQEGQLRTLQRRCQQWQALHGPEKAVMFSQEHLPGNQSQSDYTNMDGLEIKLAGQHFKHLLFHFMLTYSRWEHVMICYEESFLSLTQGYEQAVWSLGAVAKEHRTDNLSAATRAIGGGREFTERWQNVMRHYGVVPSRNNPGVSNENGSIEKSHDLFKTAVEQRLILRGNRNFRDLQEYEEFLVDVQKSRNSARQAALVVEVEALQNLPTEKWLTPKVVPVRVSPASTVQIEKTTYSVPSRLISYVLMAHIYYDKIQLYYGQKCLQEMPKSRHTAVIDYRHIIDSLLRKPGAFAHYQYREALFPQVCFRQAYDVLCQYSAARGHKYYLELLLLAKLHGEQQVAASLALLSEQQLPPLPSAVKALLDLPVATPIVTVALPPLAHYDQLLSPQQAQEVRP